MMVFMVAGCASSFETTQPSVIPDSQQPVIDSLSPAAPSGANVGLVVVNETEPAGGNGYKEVIVNPGLVNTGDQLGFEVHSQGGLHGTLEVAEGRSYTAGGTLFWSIAPIPVPPGVTVCGSDYGTFNETFENVPATAHVQTFTLSNSPSIDLGAPKGSCANPSLGPLPTSFDAKTVTAGDPGFSVSLGAVATATIPAEYGGSPAHKQTSVSVTFVNKSQLDPLDFSGQGLWVLTDKGFMLPIGAAILPGDNTCTVGPGQTRTCPLAPFNTTDDTGKPVALLVVAPDSTREVSASGAWGMASL